MEIVAEGVEVAGTHGPILLPTSLRLRDGQLLLVAGDPESGQTGLALALSGRLRPTGGTVRIDGATNPSALRRKVAVVDAPDITEPEGSVGVRDVVAEGLSLAGRPSGRGKVRSWLSQHDLAEHATERFENLPAPARTSMLVDLAAESRTTQALILVAPDRHGGDPLNWYAPARREAAGGRAVAVLCAPHSAEKLGAAHAFIGKENRAEEPLTELSTTDSRSNDDEGVR